MNQKEYAVKRYGLVSERQRLMHILDGMGDFPNAVVLAKYEANKKAIIELDAHWESQKK